jgi:polyglutamine-binding protein 1
MEKVKRRFKETNLGVKGCPNKWNVHHICTVFCLERWGEGTSKPSKSYRERYNRLLDRYPLTKNWVAVWDAGCEAFYFWNKSESTVSWLPPKHPKAVIGKSAATIRSEKDRPDLDAMEDEPMTMSAIRQSPPQSEERYQRPAPVQKKTKSRDLEKILRTKKGRKQFHETSDKLDPMDPASYSDCGRGKWSSGLMVDEGKTGVDTTASGQLFQQRPYPSPGDVLRANQAKRQETDDVRLDEDRYSEDDQ